MKLRKSVTEKERSSDDEWVSRCGFLRTGRGIMEGEEGLVGCFGCVVVVVLLFDSLMVDG